jgi:hypothetical protein
MTLVRGTAFWPSRWFGNMSMSIDMKFGIRNSK